MFIISGFDLLVITGSCSYELPDPTSCSSGKFYNQLRNEVLRLR